MSIASALVVIFGALTGAGADLLAARFADQRPTVRTVGAAATITAVLSASMLGHPPHTWHGRLMPLWALGWLLVADVDVRTHLVYRAHVVALGLIALAGAVLDHTLLVSSAGAVLVGGMLASVNVLAVCASRSAAPVVLSAGIGLLAGAGAWRAMWHETWILPIRGVTDPRIMITTFVAISPPTFAWAMGRMAASAQSRGWDGELVGWGDVMLVGLMGFWFGLHWVWQPLYWGLLAAAAFAILRWIAVAISAGSLPWLREGQWTVPGLFAGAVLLAILTGA